MSKITFCYTWSKSNVCLARVSSSAPKDWAWLRDPTHLNTQMLTKAEASPMTLCDPSIV